VVPSEVVAGRDALLQCHYDLEGSSLYALKWYKGSHGKRFAPPYTDTNHNQLFDDEFVSLFSSPATRFGDDLSTPVTNRRTTEFYRFILKEVPPVQTFPWSSITIHHASYSSISLLISFFFE
jgi:hypothetical protein